MTTIYLIGAAVTFAVLAFGSAWLHTGRKYKTSDKVYGFLFGAIIWPIVWLFAVGSALGEIARKKEGGKQ